MIADSTAAVGSLKNNLAATGNQEKTSSSTTNLKVNNLKALGISVRSIIQI